LLLAVDHDDLRARHRGAVTRRESVAPGRSWGGWLRRGAPGRAGAGPRGGGGGGEGGGGGARPARGGAAAAPRPAPGAARGGGGARRRWMVRLGRRRRRAAWALVRRGPPMNR